MLKHAGFQQLYFSYEGQNLNVEPQRQSEHPEVSTHRSEKWLLDLLGEDMEHVHGFCRQGEIGARDTLVLSELRLTGLLLVLRKVSRRQTNLSPTQQLTNTPSVTEKYSQLITGKVRNEAKGRKEC